MPSSAFVHFSTPRKTDLGIMSRWNFHWSWSTTVDIPYWCFDDSKDQKFSPVLSVCPELVSVALRKVPIILAAHLLTMTLKIVIVFFPCLHVIHHNYPWPQRQWTSDDYDCVYPKPLGSGGGVAKHLKLHVSVLVLVRQELVLKLLYETSMSSSCKFSIESLLLLLWAVKLLIFNVLVISIPVSGKTWTSSGNLGAPNPRGTSGFASSGLIFTRSRYHSIASMSGNTPVMDDCDCISKHVCTEV